jgi:hypothetical protein
LRETYACANTGSIGDTLPNRAKALIRPAS